MKTSNEFIMREIAGEYVLVPIGKRALTFQGLVTMNEVGALIWEMMEKESDIDQIVSGILDEYEVDEQTARFWRCAYPCSASCFPMPQMP